MTDVAGRRIVVVTGSPRSGTTAVGRILGLGQEVCTLHEPLNYHTGVRAVRRYFEIPGAAGFTDLELDRIAAGVEALRLSFKRGIFPEDSGARRLVKWLIGGRSVAAYRRCRLSRGVRTVVWKDPFAAFVVERLVRTRGAEAVVTVRNPWAVAASFLRLRWGFDVGDLQRRMAEAGLDGVPALDLHALDVDDPVVNGAVVWRLVYEHLHGLKHAGLPLRFIWLDDLVARPLEEYEALYRELGLSWTREIAEDITNTYDTGSGGGRPSSNRAHDQDRDLSAVNRYWRDLLSERQADQVSRIAGDLWDRLRASRSRG